jgi:hypothetical protein
VGLDYWNAISFAVGKREGSTAGLYFPGLGVELYLLWQVECKDRWRCGISRIKRQLDAWGVGSGVESVEALC